MALGSEIAFAVGQFDHSHLVAMSEYHSLGFGVQGVMLLLDAPPAIRTVCYGHFQTLRLILENLDLGS